MKLRNLALLGLAMSAVLSVLTFPALAQDSDDGQPRLGVASNGLRGLVHTALPVSPTELAIAGSAGYGFTDPIAPIDGAHHRAHGVLGVGVTPLPFLALALTVDGRFDQHPDEGEGSYGSGVGDPRLLARMGHALSDDVQIGADLGVWFPGNQAPSYEPRATSVDLRALFAYVPERSRFRLLSAAGFRLDNSAASAPDEYERLRFGDRVALGLSDSHAVLGALGAAYQFTDLELFAELSADVLVGRKAPALLASPMRTSLGARYALSRAWACEVTATAGLSKRPEVGPAEPFVPIEPRASVLIGLRFTTSFAEPKVTPADPPAPKVEPPKPEPEQPAPPALVTITGALTDSGGAPLPEVLIKVKDSHGEEREVITDAQGRYEVPELPIGPASLEASSIGFEPQLWEIEVSPELPPIPSRALVAKTSIGVLRGLIRSFASEPIQGAEVTVVEAKTRKATRVESDAGGRLEVELRPGRYRVTIRASGYRAHKRNIKIAANNVAILNVDLREQ